VNARRLRSGVRRAAHGVRDSIVRALYKVPADRAGVAPSTVPGPQGLLRVHIGCGTVQLDGWFNVDERWFPHVHHVGAADRLGVLPDGAAEVVYASHVLEHLSHRATDATLREWARVLAPGGALFVAVPDFDRIVERYVDGGRKIDDVFGPLMGEQDYDANTHRAVFNRAALADHLERAGFTDVREFRGEEILGETIWDNSKHPVSLNLTARKR
jgi:predicted SAM-dependent methyltransferase